MIVRGAVGGNGNVADDNVGVDVGVGVCAGAVVVAGLKHSTQRDASWYDDGAG